MTPEKHPINCLEAQLELELAWIDHNAPHFSAKASGYFGLVGRGAIIVDAVAKHLGKGVLFTYFPKEKMGHITDEEISQIVDSYDPTNEFVVLLLLPQDKQRAYRIGTQLKQEIVAQGGTNIEYAGT